MGQSIQRFEDLIAWQKARSLTAKIYQVSRKGAMIRDFGLKAQMQRAAVSIMSNIAEGFERGTQAEFHNFLRIAKGSCAELRSLLYVAFDAEYLSQEDYQQLCTQAEEAARVIGGLRTAVERNREAACRR
jgi:four helix bundle protein